MRAAMGRILDEPVMVAQAVQAVLTLAVAFGTHLTGDQQAAILAVEAAGIGLAAVARGRVTPTRKLDEGGPR